jgi:hypothetical protein
MRHGEPVHFRDCFEALCAQTVTSGYNVRRFVNDFTDLMAVIALNVQFYEHLIRLEIPE